nr:hypothetical protein [uncultured Dyadobacter sp.]
MNSVSRSLVRILVIASGGEKPLSPGQEDTGAWVLVIALFPFVLRVGIVLLIGSGVTYRFLFTDDIFFIAG